jgi:hypothetical protein
MDKLTDAEFDLLTASKSESEWNAACDQVKAARHGAYPSDWWARMQLSGVMFTVFNGFKE